jgi:DNA-directed RNA polymerase subunit RPC12/RpoP
MDVHEFPGVSGTVVAVDVCFPCHCLWLDKRESIHLAPNGIMDLFRVLHEHHEDARHAISSRIECPRCRRRLSLFQDIARGVRFSYYACPAGDGRLTPFSEFLKEKNFVRTLNPAELAQVRADVKQVQCSSCGAPVDLERGLACGHCGAPVSILDADAVEKALRSLHEAAKARPVLDPAEVERRARAVAAMEQLRAGPEARWNRVSRSLRVGSGGAEVDLVSACFGVIGSVIDTLT